MANRLIIHTATRVVRVLTLNPNSPVQAFETAVPVADNFQLPGPGRKLGLDNVTLSLATAQEISDALDDYQPNRVKMRTLRALCAAVGNAGNPGTLAEALQQLARLRLVVLALADLWINTNNDTDD